MADLATGLVVDIPFNWPYLTGKELGYIAEAHAAGRLAGDGPYTKRCHAWLEETTGCARALLTHSCTAALEMTALLLDVQPGDEVIMPSFTFVSTANAFVLRGARPVFVDIRADTLNLDERLVEAAITPRTRAIVAVHYAGVACEMDALAAIARRHAIALVEDAAQGVLATYRGRPLGALGDLGTYSFHETKTIISGEGGALIVNDPALAERAEVVREKGTDRSRFYRGEIDKYTWQDIGSSFLPGEIVAAFLWAQLEEARAITEQRLAIWHRYAERLAALEGDGRVRLPVAPPECRHNGQMFHVLLERGADRGEVLRRLAADGISAVFHYVPLHSSPGGRRFARVSGDMSVTDDASARLVRLPMWVGLTGDQQDRVAEALAHALGAR